MLLANEACLLQVIGAAILGLTQNSLTKFFSLLIINVYLSNDIYIGGCEALTLGQFEIFTFEVGYPTHVLVSNHIFLRSTNALGTFATL